MAAVSQQVDIGGLDTDEDEAAEIEAANIWREQLYSAIRTFVRGYAAGGLKGYDACAAALDKRWGGDKGRHVSGSLLSAALRDSERNYFRAEWLDWFARRSPDVADLMARRVKPTKTDAQDRDDIIAEMREVMSHKTVEQILRRARAR